MAQPTYCLSCNNLQPVYRKCKGCLKDIDYYCVDQDCWSITPNVTPEEKERACWICELCTEDDPEYRVDKENASPNVTPRPKTIRMGLKYFTDVTEEKAAEAKSPRKSSESEESANGGGRGRKSPRKSPKTTKTQGKEQIMTKSVAGVEDSAPQKENKSTGQSEGEEMVQEHNFGKKSGDQVGETCSVTETELNTSSCSNSKLLTITVKSTREGPENMEMDMENSRSMIITEEHFQPSESEEQKSSPGGKSQLLTIRVKSKKEDTDMEMDMMENQPMTFSEDHFKYARLDDSEMFEMIDSMEAAASETNSLAAEEDLDDFMNDENLGQENEILIEGPTIDVVTTHFYEDEYENPRPMIFQADSPISPAPYPPEYYNPDILQSRGVPPVLQDINQAGSSRMLLPGENYAVSAESEEESPPRHFNFDPRNPEETMKEINARFERNTRRILKPLEDLRRGETSVQALIRVFEQKKQEKDEVNKSKK